MYTPSFGLNRLCGHIYSSTVKEYVPIGLRSHMFVFRVSGIWPTADDSHWYKLLTITFFVFVGIIFPLSLFAEILLANSIEEAMKHSFVTLTCGATTFKAGVIYWRRNDIRSFYRIHVRLLHTTVERCTSSVRTDIRMYIILTSLYMFWWSMLCVQIIVATPEDRLFVSTLHWRYAFAENRAVYLIVLVYQVVSDWWLCVMASAQDSFYIALMSTVCGHLTQIKEGAKALGNEGAEGAKSENKEPNSRYYRELIGLCQRYEECLRLLSCNINNFYWILYDFFFVFTVWP